MFCLILLLNVIPPVTAVFLRSLLSSPFTPLPFFYLLLLSSLLLKWRKKHKLGRLLLYAAVSWMVVISTSIVPNFLIDSLEKQYPPLTDVSALSLDSGIYIMVLGAGHSTNPTLPVSQQLSETVMIRLLEAIRLHRLLPGSKLVTSGAQGKQTESQAAVVRKAAMQLGVAPEDIDTLPRTSNTMDEAQHFKYRFGTKQQVIVVTDAVHMSRAMKWFRKVGLNPIAAPTNFILKEEKSKRTLGLIPRSDHIAKMETAVHEYMGMCWARIITINDE